MHRLFKILFAILLTPLVVSSCINQFGVSGPTIGGKKRKNKVAPPYDFSKAMFDYRRERGYWPKSEMEFTSYNRQAVKNLYMQDFSDWYLGSNNQDSLYIHFTHASVTSNGHVGVVPIPVKDLKIKTLYVFSKGTTKTIRKRGKKDSE
ncbi:hypothetical protein DSL64_05040 [Dyadobacter luteus]|uniref:DUF4136 domain-containing protein n=1 Tax=Dyadobacter luteus TaxID=2259619 RepID=A0A3D8YGL6_9BACT|nr:hypothetical protein [Dyadobacter luteus]REA63791.1 hypothetical protein DSL64_05040 [Dyadobacter luteus]